MVNSQIENTSFPAALVDWAGHHSGGVKRLLDKDSGQPNKQLLRTNLLARLQDWSKRLPVESASIPRIVLLVGGPGNGKTEAIESTIHWLDSSLDCEGRLICNPPPRMKKPGAGENKWEMAGQTQEWRGLWHDAVKPGSLTAK